MGRNTKVGLNYFPLDVDFFDDEKILFTTSRFGVKCEGIILRLMCRIYRNGYFLKFDEDMALLIAKSVGDVSLHGLVMDIVNELVKRGFFDRNIFDSFAILTSAGFQKRYVKACQDSRRTVVNIDQKYNLISFTPPEMAFPRGETPKTREETPFPPVKETKLKENKINKSKLITTTENVEDDSKDSPSKLFAIWGKPNPNQGEITQIENLLKSFPYDKVKQAFYIAADHSVCKTSYVRGILNNNGIKPNGTKSSNYSNGASPESLAEITARRFKRQQN